MQQRREKAGGKDARSRSGGGESGKYPTTSYFNVLFIFRCPIETESNGNSSSLGCKCPSGPILPKIPIKDPGWQNGTSATRYLEKAN